jgi:type VI secretion system protein ImpH
LGQDVVVGTRYWDQQSQFDLVVGPMDFTRFKGFLPVGSAFLPLCEFTRFFCGVEFDFDAELRLLPEHVPESRLGGDEGPRLGWTSWLKTKPYEGEAAIVRLSPRRLEAWLGGLVP